MNTAWRFLDTGTGSAMFAMALDEAVLRAVAWGDAPPTVRLYGFAPHAVTIGYSQCADELLDLDACIAAGIDVTRRLTGGRAVLHADEVTYAVAGRADDPLFGGNIAGAYRVIGMAMRDALNEIGVTAELSRGVTGRHDGEAGRTAPCFLSTSRHEITVAGRKIAGSAQRRMGAVFLQHGSILTGPGHKRITEFLRDRRLATAWAGSLDRLTTDCAAELGNPAPTDALKDALRRSFGRQLGASLMPGEPGAAELDEANRLMRERYAKKGWVLHNGG